MKALGAPIRHAHWWEPKLAPVLGTGYATAYLTGHHLWHLAPSFALVLLALIPGAAYVSLINDLTDVRDDQAAGKPNALADRPRWIVFAALAVCCATGAAIAVAAWNRDAVAASLYAAAWISFSLYSIPPARLKVRGLFGVIADAAGADVLPQLLMVVVVFQHARAHQRLLWIVLVAIWSASHGLRSILLHQLDDRAFDARSGARTFARLHPELSRRLGAYVVFPLELASFVWMLVRTSNALALAVLPVYALLELARARIRSVNVRVVSPAPQRRIALEEYYVVFYPLSFVVAAALRHPQDALLLPITGALFPGAIRTTLSDGMRGLRRLARLGLRPRGGHSDARRTASLNND